MTDKRPQTIQFFLPQGEPREIRTAYVNLQLMHGTLDSRERGQA